MEVIYQYAWLIPVLPLFGAMLVGSRVNLVESGDKPPAAAQRCGDYLPDGSGYGAVVCLAMESNSRTCTLYPHPGVGGSRKFSPEHGLHY